jgi:hypothetical protein
MFHRINTLGAVELAAKAYLKHGSQLSFAVETMQPSLQPRIMELGVTPALLLLLWLLLLL